MTLPYDVCRCLGQFGIWTCDKRETCQRYLNRDDCGAWTPQAMALCFVNDDHYIPVTGASSDD